MVGSPEDSEIPAALLASEGISPEDFALWRMEIEDVKRSDREILADAAKADAQAAERRRQGLAPLQPDFTREESDALERHKLENELRTRRARELQADAKWGDDEEEGWDGLLRASLSVTALISIDGVTSRPQRASSTSHSSAVSSTTTRLFMRCAVCQFPFSIGSLPPTRRGLPEPGVSTGVSTSAGGIPSGILGTFTADSDVAA
jgi:hypothetical protein